MFYNFDSLTTAPDLPATTVALGCYCSMFDNCDSLKNVPEILPAENLAQECYSYMFKLTAIEKAPELPAKTLAFGCYKQMFNGCKKLNYIKMLANNISAVDCFYDWCDDLQTNGTFIKRAELNWNVRGDNGIPSGWTIVNIDSND